MNTPYEAVIGLEIHAQISSKSKLFCNCDNDSFGKEPNINTCEICMGFPGTLPVINEEAVEKSIKAALALGCEIPEESKFDRKNYFYPDLPKGFQISQYDKPIAINGAVEIETDEGIKTIGITRVHMEDDAGKLTHVTDGTLCDYNRSGTPLMEIVSEPELRSEKEACIYAKEIQKILRYVDASDCDMEKGMMRFDINVSVRKKGSTVFGTKVEIKNLNSFRALEKAIVYEIERQISLIEEGKTIVQETRGWDEEKTTSQRTKEEAQDYRYFPEPDLPPMRQNSKKISAMKKNLPELPLQKRKRFEEMFHLSTEDARILTEEIERARFFEEAVAVCNDPKKVASYMNTILAKLAKDAKTSKITPKALGKLIKLINEGKVNNNIAKGEIIEEMFKTGRDPETIIKEKGIEEIASEDTLSAICEDVIKENPKIVEQFKKGKTSVIGFFIGQVMGKTKGSANPKVLHEILEDLLSK